MDKEKAAGWKRCQRGGKQNRKGTKRSRGLGAGLTEGGAGTGSDARGTEGHCQLCGEAQELEGEQGAPGPACLAGLGLGLPSRRGEAAQEKGRVLSV